ncbi:MAG TPA: hypothetical protein DEB59_00870 [Acidimicrobiaceae bacterium]|nr:hypothetical protein [Acidimicrobiaceae bacterium]
MKAVGYISGNTAAVTSPNAVQRLLLSRTQARRSRPQPALQCPPLDSDQVRLQSEGKNYKPRSVKIVFKVAGTAFTSVFRRTASSTSSN